MRNIACPTCGYSLRGLPGVEVRCPECGQTWNLPELIAVRRRDWTRCPIYNRLGNAAIMLPIALIAAIPCAYAIAAVPNAPLPVAAVGLGYLAIWFRLMWIAVRDRPDKEAFVLLGLMQLFIVVFCTSWVVICLGVVGLVAGVLVAVMDGEVLRGLIGGAATVVVVTMALGGLALCRWLDRHIGRRCIQREMEAAAR